MRIGNNMNYDSQTKLVLFTIARFPEFRTFLYNYRRSWISSAHRDTVIIIKGQPIADKVIRELPL